MIVKAATFNHYKAIADQVIAALPEDADIETLVADETLIAEIATENAPSLSTEELDKKFSARLEELGLIDASADESIEDQLATVLGAEESYGILDNALTAAGFDTAAILEDASPESALKDAVEEAIATRAGSIATSTASAAGVPAADLPAIDEGAEPEADFATADDYWAAYKSHPVAERHAWHTANSHRCPGYKPALSA